MAARFASLGPAVLRAADARRADLTAAGPWPKADLVLASYALAEIAPERQGAVVAGLWDACEGVLALVEPGTPAGYGRILAARAALIAAGAQVLAPCPHGEACPLVGDDWCHFSVRLPRSRDHLAVKAAEVPFEDERFSYLIAVRPGVASVGRPARVIAPPRTGKPGIDLKLCAPEGVERRLVGKRDKAAFAVARRLDWGDALD
jgi:ribosomal protein RSM22 (predicted rRNA methylase)